MSLSKFTGDTNNIQSLPDQPSISASDLKARFDKTGDELKEYINDTLTEEIDESLGSKADSNNVYTKDEINGTILAENITLGSGAFSRDYAMNDNIKNYKIIEFILEDGSVKRLYNASYSSTINNFHIKYIGTLVGETGYESISFHNINIKLRNNLVQYYSGKYDCLSIFIQEGNVTMQGGYPHITFKKIIGYR